MDSSVVSARLIGAIFVEKGLITEDQLEVALEQQRTTGERLGEILVDKFSVERLDLASALAEQWAEYERQGQAEAREALIESGELLPDAEEEKELPAIPTPSVKRPIGEIFVERGLVTDAQLKEALAQQKATGNRLGEILVASGKLSRLELASALADQWATFQKLRPPAEPASAPEPAEAPASGSAEILPTPEVVVPAVSSAATAELTSRVEALAMRLDHVAAEKTDWKPQVEKTAELLRARIEHLEEQILSRSTDEAAPDDLRSEVAALIERVDAIPAPSDEWRHELAQVADNLRIRIERVEQVPVTEQVSEFRTALDELKQRLDSLPETVATEGTGGGDWHDAVEALRRQIENAGQWHEGSLGELRATVDALSERVESLPATVATESTGGGDWEDAVERLRDRVDALPAPSEEWREQIEGLAARVDTLPTDAWRPELAEVAENLRTRIERLEHAEPHPAVAPEELHELRGALDALRDQVDGKPETSDEWREPLEALAARIDALPMDAWRRELAEVAENLRTRVERLEQEEPQTVQSDEWREPLEALAARIDALPMDSWRPELAEVAENLRTRVEQVEADLRGASATTELDELRTALAGLNERIDAIPAPTDEWRHELAAMAENLRTRLERVEFESRHAAPGGAIDEIRAALDVLAERVESSPPPAEEWREPVAGLEARVDALAAESTNGELAAAADALQKRIERIEEGMVGQARAASVTEIAAQVAELGQKVAGTEALAAHVQSVADRIESMPTPSEEWRDQIAELAGRLDRVRTDEWRHELALVADNLRSRVERVEQHLNGDESQHVTNELRSRVDELSTRLDDTSALDDVLRRIAAVSAVAGRVDEVEQRLAHETASVAGVGPALEDLRQQAEQDRARIERLTGLVTELAERRDAAVVERELMGRAGALEHAVGELREGIAALRSRIDEGIAGVEARAVTQAQQAVSAVDSLRRQVDDLRAMVSGAGEATAHAVAELKSAVDGNVARLDSLQSVQASFEQQTEERAAGRSADLSALRARLETVETALSGAAAWEQAVGAANERVDRLETLMVETSASEAVERNTEVEGLRVAMSERVAALESTQLKRKDLRELRDELTRVEARVEERGVQDDAASRAIEEAVREGLVGLGERLAAAEATYLVAGKVLSRSIEGLGQAIAGADVHLSGIDPDVASAIEETSYVAFAPTTEGYRLVVCNGRAPDLGGRVEIPELEGALVVSRVGASPLPFDARRCVFLEHA